MKIRNVPTGIAGIYARISYRPQDDGRILLCGYAQADGAGRAGNDHEHIFDPATEPEDSAVRYLVARIADDYRRRHPKVTNGISASSPSLKSGFFSDAISGIEKAQLLSPNWRASTSNRAWSYFCNQVLPRMDQYGASITEEDMDVIFQDLVSNAYQSEQSNREWLRASQSVRSLLVRVDQILGALQTHRPDLPQVKFGRVPINIAELEQVKSLPDEVRVKMAYVLLHSVDNGLALGAALMWLCGLRTAEACAPLIGELKLHDGWFATYFVQSQICDGERVRTLKTPAAYRTAIGGKLMHDLVELRIKYLKEKGYSDNAIANMPFVPAPDNPTAFASPSQLAAYGKRLMLACGYSSSTLDAAIVTMLVEPDVDVDGKKPERYVSAYIMRRDFTSRGENVCGITRSHIDKVIGHATKEPTPDFNSCPAQRDFAAQLENSVLDPDHTQNPKFHQYIAKNGRQDLTRKNAYRIVAGPHPVQVTTKIRTREGGGDIRCRTSGKYEGSKVSIGERDLPELRRGRPILIIPRDREYYEKLKAEAATIDIAKI